MKPKIIMNADDFGAMDGIDNGIIKGIECGVVNSVSAFTNFPDSKERVQRLISNPNIEGKFRVGLHLSITSGYGDNPEVYPTLMQKNTNKFATIKGIKLPIIKIEELRNCLWEQIHKLADFLGGYEYIDHINMHHNLCTLYKPFFPILLEIVEELKNKGYDIPLRSPMLWSKSGAKYYVGNNNRIPIQRKALDNLKYLRYMKNGRLRGLISLLKGAFLKNAQYQLAVFEENNIRHAYSFIDQYFGQASEKNIKHIYENHPNGEIIEFMLHLFEGQKERKNGIDYSYLNGRRKELNELIKHFKPENYEFVNHSDI